MAVKATKSEIQIRDELTSLSDKGKNRVVCFVANRSASYTVPVGFSNRVNMVYNQVKLNIGNCYDYTTGIFTAPADGLYEFAWASIASNINTVYRYVLSKNGSVSWTDKISNTGGYYELRIDKIDVSSGSNEYGTNGEMCTYLELDKGDEIAVTIHSDDNAGTVYGSPSYIYTYFRGRLLQEYGTEGMR